MRNTMGDRPGRPIGARPVLLAALVGAAASVLVTASAFNSAATPKEPRDLAYPNSSVTIAAAGKPSGTKGCPTGAHAALPVLAGPQDEPTAKKKARELKQVKRGTAELGQDAGAIDVALDQHVVDRAKCEVSLSASWRNGTGSPPAVIRLKASVADDGGAVRIWRDQGCADCPLRVTWQLVEWK